MDLAFLREYGRSVAYSFSIHILQDFAHYKSGVYKHITGGVMGGHAVKLIGWGTSDAGEDYWVLDTLYSCF